MYLVHSYIFSLPLYICIVDQMHIYVERTGAFKSKFSMFGFGTIITHTSCLPIVWYMQHVSTKFLINHFGRCSARAVVVHTSGKWKPNPAWSTSCSCKVYQLCVWTISWVLQLMLETRGARHK